jgi:hypothetical protein
VQLVWVRQHLLVVHHLLSQVCGRHPTAHLRMVRVERLRRRRLVRHRHGLRVHA